MDHHIRIEFDPQYEVTTLVFGCTAAPDAPCHMVCPKSCESCDHERTEQVAYCNPSEFINNHDETIQTAEKQPYIYLPVELSWNGDTYVWTALPVRNEATVKAEALREAATAARAEAANSRTPQGHAEATTYADWLDDRATEIDPARLEGAHP